jgi:hypothetical protein
MVLRVYADREHYSDNHRKALNDILKAFWTTGTLEQRRATYGNRPDLFELVSAPDAADLHLLTMKWQHYVEQDRVDQVLRSIELARRARRPIAVFSASDFEANFPVAGSDIHLFQASGYRSRRRQTNHGMPAFFEDPLPTFCDGQLRLREKGPRPVVGFCGQAGASLAHHAARVVRNRVNRVAWRLGRRRWEPPPLEHTWFRQRVLNTFQRSASVDARFVLRVQYRAGLGQVEKQHDSAARSRREFIDNILDTDYTVCVRGGGNFSVRFFEALALGRIPAFVDTDCLLPYYGRVDWRRYAVWIDACDEHDAPEIVARYHDRLSPQEFRERQRECRHLWEDRLTPDGFYAHFHEHFPELGR